MNTEIDPRVTCPGVDVRPSAQVALAADRTTVDSLSAQVARRRAASYRLISLACGRRDPLDPAEPWSGPCSYGLTPEELRAHARKLHQDGWDVTEITAVLTVPEPRRPE